MTTNNAAKYNWITPDQYNDMHPQLTGGFTYHGTHYTGDSANIAQGDNFLSMVVPLIMVSSAYQNNGAIVLWFDETKNGDDSAHTLGEIIISPDAKGNAFTNNILYTHSSDLLTMEEIFGLAPCLRGVCSATDLSDLFVPGSIPPPVSTPEPSTISAGVLGIGALVWLRYGFRNKKLMAEVGQSMGLQGTPAMSEPWGRRRRVCSL